MSAGVSSPPGVHVAPHDPVRRGRLHAVAAGMLARLRLLPRHHVLLHLLFLSCRLGAVRQAGWPATPRQPGRTNLHQTLDLQTFAE